MASKSPKTSRPLSHQNQGCAVTPYTTFDNISEKYANSLFLREAGAPIERVYLTVTENSQAHAYTGARKYWYSVSRLIPKSRASWAFLSP